MSLFDSIIGEANNKFDLGDKAGTLLSTLLGLMKSPEDGGFSGFVNRFRDVGLGSLVDSWITTGDNMPISNEQVETAFGAETISAVAAETGIDRKKTTSALAFMTPQVVNALTPRGAIPDEGSLLSTIGGYLSGFGGAVGGAADRIDAAAGATYDAGKLAAGSVGGAMNSVGNSFDGDNDGDDGSFLKWLIPLLLLGLLIVLGYMFCGKSTTNIPAAANSNKITVTNTTANAPVKTVDSSFNMVAKNGKYTVSGIVPDQKTLDDIKAKLTAEFGAENVDFSGLKVDANAKSFAAGWWDNFGKLLPSLKDWKNGTLSFAGNAITAASGLPQAAMDQLKLLFSSWTMPSLSADATTGADRKLTDVSLPNGTKLQAYPGGIEDQLIKFIESDEYKNGTADSLKEKWFSFDDLNFEFGTTQLVPASKRQLDNIAAILKAFPDVKIKIGGYTDKKGDDAANKKLSDDRAKAVKDALTKAGVGAQVPEAEGYGEEFATVPETASDKEREADRKTSVRLLK